MAAAIGTSPTAQAPLLVTGANGHLGRKLIAALRGERPVRALVRSQRAADTIRSEPECSAAEIRVLDYTDERALGEAAIGCSAAVHLVGIIKESRDARYVDAHEGTCRVLARVAERAGLQRIVYLSILGARPDADNACLASKGRAEQILLEGGVPAVVLRVPMVLGPDDIASRALRGQALAPRLFLVGGGRTWQQPIDAGDVVRAIRAALERPGLEGAVLDLAGPESLPQRELVARAAALHGRHPRIRGLPLALARAGAWLVSRVSASPPITPAMLGVLQHDDRIDPKPACERLGIELTPLDQTLARCLGPAE